MRDRTARRGATSQEGMEPLEQQFHAARKDMIDAFADLSSLAAQAGVEWESITHLHGRFFDGNVEIKDAYSRTAFFAWLRRS